MEVVGIAHNGVVPQTDQSQIPDCVTDVRIPGLDGLELIEQATG